MSRDIDALVSKHVFGYEYGSEKDRYINGLMESHRYSTDIAAAWRVVEKLNKDKCFHLVEDRYGGSYSRGKWLAYFGINVDGVVQGSWGGDIEAMEYWDNPTPGVVANDSAPMAICLAAIKSVGAEIPQEIK